MMIRLQGTLFFVFLLVSMRVSAAEEVFLWIESEDFISATEGIMVVTSEYALRSEKEQKIGESYLKKGGRDIECNGRVSNGAYIELRKGERFIPNVLDYLKYDFYLPEDGDYYIWIRCDSPPPCYRFFNIWFDDPTLNKKKCERLNFDYGGLWSWWPWGNLFNSGVAKGIPLEKGNHSMFIGDMSYKLRIDSIVVTNNQDYRPFGINRFYYTSTFEPPLIKGAHNWDSIEPEASGWGANPPERWIVCSEPVRRNYYYAALGDLGEATETTLLYSLIKNLKCVCFKADFNLLLRPEIEGTEPNALLVYSFKDKDNFHAVQFEKDSIKVLYMENGEESIKGESPYVIEKREKSYNVTVTRNRTNLIVEIENKNVLNIPFPIDEEGSIGIGSYRGGVGFDDIYIIPINEPEAEYDFEDRSNPSLEDWVLVHNGEYVKWENIKIFEKDDILLYKAPYWSNSEVKVDIKEGEYFSILFPYKSAEDNVEVMIDYKNGNKIEVYRNSGDKKEILGSVNLEEENEKNLSIQSVRGLFCVFQNDKKLVESNVYDLIRGTFAVKFHENKKEMPIEKISIKRKEIVFDSFPVTEGKGELSSEWKIKSGKWKVESVLEGQYGGDDGQLISQGKGTILIGKENWISYYMETSVNFEETTEMSLLGWAGRNNGVELYCKGEELKIRKVIGDEYIILKETRVKGLGSGWHKLGYTLGQEEVTGEVDGVEYIRLEMKGSKGCAGIRNYGEFLAVDDFVIHILTMEEAKIDSIKNVDTTFINIESSILK